MNESRIDTIEIQSRALEKTMAMKVYVPANGNEGMTVLYLMHGRSGDENMMNVLNIPSAADKMIATGAIQPMVIVCPRMDDALGLDAYESYFFDEIIPLIDRRYHTGVRHIGGFSAGGYIALRYALLHPSVFLDDHMVVGTSAMIQTELDCIVNQYTDQFCNPMVMWGKYRKGLFKTTLPVSFQFHHVQMDGGHAAHFLDELQKTINSAR